MTGKFFRDGLLASTIIATGLIAAPLWAQDATTPVAQGPAQDANTSTVAPIAPGSAAPADASATDTTGGTIVVTGSRIAQPNLTSASPITAVNQQEIRLQGASRIEDVLNQLPQAIATQNSSVSNGATGIATANLRNLGDNRTLVLINGRRLQPGNPGSGAASSAAPDLNVVPSFLIKRVDVLTGGASSVYGSDAVAGVVNFVMDTDYEGVAVDSTYGLATHTNDSARFQALTRASGYNTPSGDTVDGRQFDITMKLGAGTKDGNGHVVGYLGYRKIGAILQADRDYSACALNAGATNFSCSGSATAAPANFLNGLPGSAVTGIGPNGTIKSSNIYNTNPLNYYQRPDKRYTAGFFAHYDISDAIKPYAEFNFMDDRTSAQIAPGGLFLGSGSISNLNCNNPLLSAAQLAAICTPANLVMNADGTPTTYLNPDGTPYNRANVTIGRRNVEGGGRLADLRHTSYRGVIGSRGDIAKGISYDVYGQFGATVYNEVYRNEFSLTKATRATDVITGANGQPVCRSVVDGSDPNCVPLDVFSTTPISAAALNYVSALGLQTGETKEKVVSGSVTFLGGEYGIKSPLADDGVALNVGAEYRKESVRLEVDQEFLTGDLTGQGGPTLPIHGSFDVKEAFAELQVPLASDRPFLQELSLNAGYRYSSYSTAGSTNSYKAEAVWAPIRDIRFRGGYNRAVRAPNTQELFASQVLGLGGSNDPCAGATPQFTAAQCARTGVTAAEYGRVAANPSAQYNDIEGGNTNLRPEKADTFTVGVILQPSFLRGFSVSVDAFSIKVKDLIGTVGADTIVSQCGLTGDQALCSLIHRDTAGTLWASSNAYTLNTNINAGDVKTRGIDVSASYTLRTDKLGTFGLSFTGTYLDEYRVTEAGADFDCAGLYGTQCATVAATPEARWKHQARLSWNLPNGIGISGRWRYISHVTFEQASDQADLAASGVSPLVSHIKAQSYFDLTATARVADHLSLRVGVENLLDRDPPIVGQSAAAAAAFGNGNTFPGVYDATGRYVFAGVSMDF